MSCRSSVPAARVLTGENDWRMLPPGCEQVFESSAGSPSSAEVSDGIDGTSVAAWPSVPAIAHPRNSEVNVSLRDHEHGLREALGRRPRTRPGWARSYLLAVASSRRSWPESETRNRAGFSELVQIVS